MLGCQRFRVWQKAKQAAGANRADSVSTGMLIFFLLLLLSQHTPLKRYCVHNTLPFASSSGLSPGIARPKFRGPRSASIARSQVWLGLPAGRFQSGGTCRMHAARARWWSSRGELRAIWPKSRRRLLVTRWESGEQPVVLLTGASDFRANLAAKCHPSFVSSWQRTETSVARLWLPRVSFRS